MHEPSDGIAEELERQLQLTLATAAIAARRVIAARQQTLQQAQRESEHAARTVQARIDAERLLATQRLRPVFDAAWWETANPQQIADMWQQADSWRDPDRGAPTIFDHAADRIREEVRDRSGLDPTQITALAAVQELEHEHQTTIGQTAEEHRPVATATRCAARVRRPPPPRAALGPSHRRGRARAGNRGANARRPRPRLRSRRRGTHSYREHTRAPAHRRRPLRPRPHATTVSARITLDADCAEHRVWRSALGGHSLPRIIQAVRAQAWLTFPS